MPVGAGCPGEQAQLEEALFTVMRGRGFGDVYEARYRMVSTLHLQRRPLIIFLCGSACTGAPPTPLSYTHKQSHPRTEKQHIALRRYSTCGLTATINPETEHRLLSADRPLLECL